MPPASSACATPHPGDRREDRCLEASKVELCCRLNPSKKKRESSQNMSLRRPAEPLLLRGVGSATGAGKSAPSGSLAPMPDEPAWGANPLPGCHRGRAGDTPANKRSHAPQANQRVCANSSLRCDVHGAQAAVRDDYIHALEARDRRQRPRTG